MTRIQEISKWLLGAGLVLGSFAVTAQNEGVMNPDDLPNGQGDITPEDDGWIDRDAPGVWSGAHDKNNRVIPYPFRRQDDYMWSTRHWEFIDIRERINHPLYYPIRDLPDRQSLFSALIQGINNGEVSQVFRDDMFQQPFQRAELLETIKRPDTIFDPDDPTLVLAINQLEYKSNNVLGWRIKSDWFFDKVRGEMVNRIIAIAPYVQDIAPDAPENSAFPLFWVWYPDAREVLARAESYNPNNRTQRLSFDDIFHKRMFNAIIYKEDNTYNRDIEQYKEEGLDRLLESQAIRERLRNYEHDLWEF